MNHELLTWDIYEITTAGAPVNGVKLRGRIRKFGIAGGFNVLAENTADVENGVRFAVLDKQAGEQVAAFVRSLVEGCSVTLVAEAVPNPVLSKLVVNEEGRYDI